MNNNCKKFRLYLPERYFQKNCCGKCNEKIKDEISLRGVEVLSQSSPKNRRFFI